ncbi:MAG: site-specific DNA-methyltransferase, partial [Senegalia sp. (in: firmicutes)]|uniref:site-specific DNA-methyltransferase n=1 Tax=Senegalia sp. (in: firmicutes) TaxID=1924098 RepID=UPI003F9A6C57
NYNTDVVLDFPHKDSVLEGGMSNEENEKREVFYHNILAKEEIDTLLAPKILSNIKKYDKNGEYNINEFTDKDNLIIKGNNLIALYSLKEIYENKVKLIYIDPPYNTGNDSFRYNDKFNHSTWLTFMKNRLILSRDLLSDNGIIFIHCDNNESAYLKVLADEIFGRKNFIETITTVNNPRGRDYGGIANMHEYIHVYAKTDAYQLNLLIDKKKEFDYKDEISGFDIRELRNRNTRFNDKNRPNLCYPFYINEENVDENGFYEISLDKKEGYIELYPLKSQGIQTVWRWGRPKSQENINVNIKARKMNNGGYQIIEKYRKNTYMARSVWWDKSVNSERGTVHLRKLFNGKVFDYPKPEEVLERIIEIGSNEGDIVLDFFMGSATTQAVAHKMNRQYIGIEQMDYINTVSVPRLQKVIDGEQGGISKDVDWKGGGSFVYAELFSLNEKYIKNIQASNSEEELEKVLFTMKESAYLNFKVDLEKVSSKNEEYNNLSLEEKKEVLIQTLDMNQLYLSYSEMEDEQYNIPEDVKAFNHSFYDKEGVKDE